MLLSPRFHHLHLRSVDPETAIEFYARQFPSCEKGQWAGLPALLSPNDVMILFDRMDTPPPKTPQSALWHFGWHVKDSRATTAEFASREEVIPRPLYSGIANESVLISSDTWFRDGDELGVSKRQIAEYRAQGAPIPGGPGFAYFEGPEEVLFEIAGDYPDERFNHVHMWQEDPLCAQLWYQKHFNAPPRASFGDAGVTEVDCKVPRTEDFTYPALNPRGMYRAPRGGVTFGDVDLIWYPNQGEEPLAPSVGQFQDHIGLSVANLDAWVNKLKKEGITFLSDIYTLGETRAVMIEGPSREGLELVEKT
jgi:catechol 2,3-dioxygenase-like lactoylglutathione lyase family enzyme